VAPDASLRRPQDAADTLQIDLRSAFSWRDSRHVRPRAEGRVRYLLVSGRQDDGLWGTLGAIWLSEDRARGGFLVNPWALWEGSEIVRGYRGALERRWTPEHVYDYWRCEVWRGPYSVDEELEAGSLLLLSQLVDAL
jgi:hypothetical protein